MSQMWIYLDSVNAECLFKECKKYTLLCKNRLKVNLLKFAVMFSQMERLFRWDSSTTARKISRPTSRVWEKYWGQRIHANNPTPGNYCSFVLSFSHTACRHCHLSARRLWVWFQLVCMHGLSAHIREFDDSKVSILDRWLSFSYVAVRETDNVFAFQLDK